MSQALIDAAKASVVAYNEKNWDAVTKVVTSDVEYDEVATNRKVAGPSAVITAWKAGPRRCPIRRRRSRRRTSAATR